jgi:uncharacterized delta-60 repeat protein
VCASRSTCPAVWAAEAKVAITTPANSTVPIIMAGFLENGRSAIASYKVDGSPDPAFGVGGQVLGAPSLGVSYAYAGLWQAGNKILVGGELYGEPHRFGMVRFNANGSVDTTFGAGGVLLGPSAPYAFAQSMANTADGRFVVAGGYSAVALARYWQ